MAPQQITTTTNESETANASTGPRTAEGKAISSRNALQHGLASEKMIMPGESAAEWEAFRDGMFAEWLPTTLTEEVLVGDMAKHQWLKDRAIRLQNEMLEVALNMEERIVNRFSVLLRYQTTNERGFVRARKQIEELRKNRQFVSQSPELVSQDVDNNAESATPPSPKRSKVRRMPTPQSDLIHEIDRQMREMDAALGMKPLPFGIAS